MRIKKIFLLSLCLFVFTFDGLYAQQKYRKVLFQKDTCFVYPYRINNAWEYSYYNMNDFMPCIDSLPDGKFVVYGEETIYKYQFYRFGRMKIKLDTTEVCLVFTSHNGKRNGPCWWYEDEKLRATGFYLNDAPDGVWIYFSGKDTKVSAVYSMKSGLNDGPFASYYSNGNVMENGLYVKGEQYGEWKSYYDNGNIEKIYTVYPDSFGIPPLNYMYPSDYPLYYYEVVDNSRYLFGNVYSYYENGNIEYIRNYLYGHVEINDTVYNSDGSIRKITKLEGYTPDSIPLISVSELEGYFYGGYSYIHYYKNTTEIKEYEFLKGHLIAENYHFDNTDSVIPGKLYPYSITYDTLGKITGEEYYYRNPGDITDVYFYKNPLEDGFINDYKYIYDTISGNISAQKHKYNIDSTYHIVSYYSGNVKEGIEHDSSLTYANNRLFTGKFLFNTKNGRMDKANLRITENQIIATYYSSYLNSRYQRRYYTYTRSGELNYVNGKENGIAIRKTKKNRILETSFYKNGLLDGELTEYQFCWKGKKRYWGLKKQETYKEDMVEGVSYEYNKHGSIAEKSNYSKGLLNGERLVYTLEYDTDKNYLSCRVNYINDTLDGKFEMYYSNGQVEKSANYKKGEYDGKVYIFNLDGSKNYELNFSNGFFYGDNFEYYLDPSNTIKSKTSYSISDSVIGQYMGYYDLLSMEKCSFTSYYKDGVKKASEGCYNEYENKTGTWNYWDDNGTLVKQSEYSSGKLPNPLSEIKNDSVYYIGKITEWYNSGKIKSTGYILEESETYNCRVEQYVPEENIYYTAFWSADGTQIVNDRNGKLVSYYDDGKIQTQTIIKEGLKEGLYKEWDPDGHLNVLGSYKNGLKEGRWLSGDLEGVSYVDNQCFSSEEDFQNALRSSREDISITVTYFLKGEEVKSFTYYKNASSNYNYYYDGF